MYFYKASTNFHNYVLRAQLREIFRRRLSAIDILQKALQVDNIKCKDNERFFIYLCIGEMYFKLKQYENAAIYFNNSLDILENSADSYFEDTNFPYIDWYNDIIKTYMYVGEKSKSFELYNDFLKRQKYDINFKNIGKVSKLFK